MPKKIKHKIIECKRCSNCKRWQPLKYFFKDKNSWDGFYHKCKICCIKYNLKRSEKIKQYNKEYHKQHYIKHPREPMVKHKTIYGVRYKRCSKCKTFKTLDQFYKNKGINTGLSDWCIVCKNI